MTRRRRILIVLALLALALLLALLVLSRPRSVGAIVARQLGTALGLEIEARGITEYRLRGTPMLVLRDVRAREPGAAKFLLSAKRISVALPWSTLRAGGSELVADRIELDSPHLDLPALQHWLSTRPPSEKRMPALTHGLRIRDGEILNDDWRIDGIDAELSELQPTQALRARLRGRYLDAPLSIPVDLAVSIVRPQALIESGTTGFATHGTLSVEHGKDWRLPATVTLSGPLRIGADELQIAPARLGAAARYESGASRIPFALGMYGPLRFDEATWTLSPAGVALRQRGKNASDPMPQLDAHGTLALGRKLTLRLDGQLARWPDAWPALPPPIGQSRSALSFTLRYDGSPGFEDVSTLRLQRDATTFAGRFELARMLAWIDGKHGSPLPPLSGSLSAPKVEIAGAALEGVHVEFDDSETSVEEGTQ